MDDLELLRDYAESRSELAFTKLVQRHANLVYSTALRLVQERPLAEEVTQLVFIRLARKAGSLQRGVVVTGWLYRTTQFIAQTVRRSDWRRRQRETLAMEFSELNRDGESVWKEVAPLLEEAMGGLRQEDQDAVLLRYFAGKSLREVGTTLGISDDTAQKRVQRALERMRDFFARRGVAVSAAILGAMLAEHTVQAAPVGFASTLATAAAAAIGGGLDFATNFKLVQTMLMAKLKASGVSAMAVLILVLGGAVPFLNTPAGMATATNTLSNAVFVVRGQVQTIDGKPLAGALVRVATPEIYVRLYQTTNAVAAAVPATNSSSARSNSPARAPRQAASAVTAADGKFVIGLADSPKEGLAAVVVNSDAGYGLATAAELSENPVIVVQPWARLEGVLRVGKTPASNTTVSIGIWGANELFDWNLVQHGASTRTDAQGRFVFPRIAPVDVWLTHSVTIRPNESRQSGHQYVKVHPGARIQVELGGAGRALSGRVLWDSTNKVVITGSMWANPARGMRQPRHWKSLTRDEQRQLTRDWRDSAEGEVWKDSVRNYEFAVQPDGRFRVEDVRPGNYRMQVRGDAPKPGGNGTQRAAVAEIQVDVPERVADDSDAPIDIGELIPASGPER